MLQTLREMVVSPALETLLEHPSIVQQPRAPLVPPTVALLLTSPVMGTSTTKQERVRRSQKLSAHLLISNEHHRQSW